MALRGGSQAETKGALGFFFVWSTLCIVGAQFLAGMACEIDTAVDRATKIINHLREFGRKSDLSVERVQPNAVLRKAFDLFSKQLVLRQIEVVWDLDPDLPEIMRALRVGWMLARGCRRRALRGPVFRLGHPIGQGLADDVQQFFGIKGFLQGGHGIAYGMSLQMVRLALPAGEYDGSPSCET